MGNKLYWLGVIIAVPVIGIIYSGSEFVHTESFKTFIAPLIAVAFVVCLAGRLLEFLEDIVGKKDKE